MNNPLKIKFLILSWLILLTSEAAAQTPSIEVQAAAGASYFGHRRYELPATATMREYINKQPLGSGLMVGLAWRWRDRNRLYTSITNSSLRKRLILWMGIFGWKVSACATNGIFGRWATAESSLIPRTNCG